MSIIAQDRSVRTYDKAGHLHVEMANISKANVCPYLGREIPNADALGLDPDRVYKLLRDPAELAKAANTFTGKPLVLKHRPQTAEDHDRAITVGAVGEAIFVPPYLRAPLAVWDGAGIEAIETGQQRQLSCGYFYRADMTPGEFEGEAYDGRMVDLAGNHVALVDTGRAGPDVFVGDHLPLEIQDMPVLSRKAAVVKGALSEYLRPRMAADASLNLSPLVREVTAKNWPTVKPKVVEAVKAAAKGKLAEDATLDDLPAALQAFDRLAADEADDDEDDDKDKKKVAEDEDEDDEDEDKKKDKDKSSKAAMDAAISAAVQAAEARFRAIREAELAVAPIVEIKQAMDSADAVYKLALDHLGVEVTGIHPSAYPALLKVAQTRAAPAPRLAQDTAGAETRFAKMFPEARPLIRS
jgi:hypothetical protein